MLILVTVWIYIVPQASGMRDGGGINVSVYYLTGLGPNCRQKSSFAIAPEYPSGTLAAMAFVALYGAFIIVRRGRSPQRLDLRYLAKLDENLRRDILDLCKESITKEELIFRLKEKGWKIGK